MNEERTSGTRRTSQDQFTQEILRNYLVATVREMVETTVRTAYSSTFSEGRDFSCSLFDHEGRMIAQDLGLAVHLGSLEQPVRAILEKYAGQLAEGDVVILNDPYLGTHHADCVVARPLFHTQEFYGLAVNIGHWTDVGGMSAGGCSGIATHVVQEGLIIPITKLYEAGNLNPEIKDFILLNVRTQEDVWGDLQSQVASTVTAERRLAWLIGRYGMESVRLAMDNAVHYSRRRFVAALASVPPGKFESEDVMEDDGVSSTPSTIRVAVTKANDRLRIDFDGTSRQARGPINCSFSVTKAACYAAAIATLDPEIPVNSGCFEQIDISVEPGLLVNPTWPAPVFGSTFDVGVRIFETIIRALAQALPEKALAGSYSSGANITGWGYRSGTGDEFLWYHFGEGGLGARAGRDGNSGTWHLMGNPRNQPVEVWEHRFPLRIEALTLVSNSAGHGEFRGGFGLERRFRLLEDTYVSGLADRHRVPPIGLNGGGEGTCNKWSIVRGEQEKRIDEWFDLPSRGKFFNLPLKAGDVLVLRQGGGGGMGNPSLRDPELVEKDIANGFISGEIASEVYDWSPKESRMNRLA